MPASRSRGKKPKVEDRRYLQPDEAHRLIDAAGKRGRYPFRDRVLVRLVYRHGLRASEAVNMRWSQVDLDAGVLHVARVKGSIDSTHSLDRDELRDLRKRRQQVTGLYVFETERGGPLSVDALQYIMRQAGRLAKLDVEARPHMLRHAAVLGIIQLVGQQGDTPQAEYRVIVVRLLRGDLRILCLSFGEFLGFEQLIGRGCRRRLRCEFKGHEHYP
jgi:integrase